MTYRPSRSGALGGASKIHLVDGTYELFRHYHALPTARDRTGRDVAAVRGVLRSVLSMLRAGVTHLAVATDHVIESFRNRMWPGYKSSEGVPAALLQQFGLLEDTLAAAGVAVWPMTEFEADDALASGAVQAAAFAEVEQVILCTPDKDLAQCVRGRRVVQLDRRRRRTRDEDGVMAAFGVAPASIPDYLALTGDTADGYPGLPGWGPKSAGTLLRRFHHLEAIPLDWRAWPAGVVSPQTRAETLRRDHAQALLFRELARLRTDVPVFENVEQLRWNGPGERFGEYGALLDSAVTEARASAPGKKKRF